jgi:hypothetical protein
VYLIYQHPFVVRSSSEPALKVETKKQIRTRRSRRYKAKRKKTELDLCKPGKRSINRTHTRFENTEEKRERKRKGRMGKERTKRKKGAALLCIRMLELKPLLRVQAPEQGERVCVVVPDIRRSSASTCGRSRKYVDGKVHASQRAFGERGEGEKISSARDQTGLPHHTGN